MQSCISDNTVTTVYSYSDEQYNLLSQHLNLPAQTDEYTVIGENQDAIATLGRVLFYDVNLSIDNSKSCASCHNQKLGFADDVNFSEGVAGAKTKRNSLALGMGGGSTLSSFYEAFNLGFFWDERAMDMQTQILETIQNEDEMGMEMQLLNEKLSEIPYYKILFDKAFQNGGKIESRLITDALEAFVNAISTKSSKLEKALEARPKFTTIEELLNIDLGEFNPSENRGKKLFIKKCGSCHNSSIAKSFDNFFIIPVPEPSANNGLDLAYEDEGVYEISLDYKDKGKFKIPFLKNIALTGPYMHDGRFTTLEEVIDFYSDGIQNHVNLSPKLKDGYQAKKFNFTEQEKEDLINFLHTLTDVEMLNEAKYSDPFL